MVNSKKERFITHPASVYIESGDFCLRAAAFRRYRPLSPECTGGSRQRRDKKEESQNGFSHTVSDGPSVPGQIEAVPRFFPAGQPELSAAAFRNAEGRHWNESHPGIHNCRQQIYRKTTGRESEEAEYNILLFA